MAEKGPNIYYTNILQQFWEQEYFWGESGPSNLKIHRLKIILIKIIFNVPFKRNKLAYKNILHFFHFEFFKRTPKLNTRPDFSFSLVWRA
jgi:hypothetical protein